MWRSRRCLPWSPLLLKACGHDTHLFPFRTRCGHLKRLSLEAPFVISKCYLPAGTKARGGGMWCVGAIGSCIFW